MDRWNRFKALSPEQQKDVNTLVEVCGVINENIKCQTLVGRPPDSETENCDKMCCYQGYLTGKCEKDFNFVLTDVLQLLISKNKKFDFITSIAHHCECTNDYNDAFCGPDGRFLGISCPFDRSACARACCRKGKTGGRCGGFLNNKCKCD